MTNASKSPGMAIASLILGVGAFFVSLLPIVGFASIPFAVVGIALGIAGVMRSSKGFEGKGLSIAGMASGVAALFVSGAYLLFVGATMTQVDNDIDTDPYDGFCNTARYLQDPDC